VYVCVHVCKVTKLTTQLRTPFPPPPPTHTYPHSHTASTHLRGCCVYAHGQLDFGGRLWAFVWEVIGELLQHLAQCQHGLHLLLRLLTRQTCSKVDNALRTVHIYSCCECSYAAEAPHETDLQQSRLRIKNGAYLILS